MSIVVRRNRRALVACSALAVVIGLSSVAASGATIPLSGSGQMTWTAQFLGSSGGNTQTTPNPSLSQGNNYSLAVPGQYAFLDQFANQQNVLTGPGTGSPVGSYAFQDTYEFSLSAPAAGDVLTVSLNLGAGTAGLFNIDDLQFRLFEVPSASTPPSIGIPAGSTIVTNWQGISGNDSGTPITASFTNALSGTYFLQVAGTADGTSGGTYVGQLNLEPVPLPAALPLLLSGLAGLGAMARDRKFSRA
jgi:hypothetical protein